MALKLTTTSLLASMLLAGTAMAQMPPPPAGAPAGKPAAQAPGGPMPGQSAAPAPMPKGAAGGADAPPVAPRQAGPTPDPAMPKRDAQQAPEPATKQDAQKTPDGTQQRAKRASPETTGSVDLTPERRSTIRQTIVRQNVKPMREVNFSVNIGVAVPRNVEVYVLPAQVVEVVPQYRGYRYFVLADGRIVILDPDTFEIVYVFEG
ncbi:MAG TPA: DUF1236 domain-containing protein [Xanthobacteraceae bacterium]|nr:DUF1236 domain-containing protein [Xanthobacteraceae bacterium]